MRDDNDPLYDARNGIHAGLTAILAWLAFRLWLPDDLFATSSNFAYMARVASEDTWAVCLWAAANIGAIGLVSGNRVLKLISVLIVATTHGIFAGCLLMGGTGTGTGTYAIIAAMGYYLAYRRARAGI
jgi:hypothetical protein